MVCSICGGVLALLGQLRKLVHFRCTNCGMLFSYPEDQVCLEEDDE